MFSGPGVSVSLVKALNLFMSLVRVSLFIFLFAAVLSGALGGVIIAVSTAWGDVAGTL